MKTKPNRGLNKKLQILVTEETWVSLNQHLNKDIVEGNVNARISFSEYIRGIILTHLKNK